MVTLVPATRLGLAVPVPPFASGTIPAATARFGDVVGFVTVGTSHVGQLPAGAVNVVTPPPPPPEVTHAEPLKTLSAFDAEL